MEKSPMNPAGSKQRKKKSKAGRPEGPAEPLSQADYDALVLFAKFKKSLPEGKADVKSTKPYPKELQDAIEVLYGKKDDKKKGDKKTNKKKFSGQFTAQCQRVSLFLQASPIPSTFTGRARS
jgi:hypothetical protein